jgi:hypothetical protein
VHGLILQGYDRITFKATVDEVDRVLCYSLGVKCFVVQGYETRMEHSRTYKAVVDDGNEAMCH